MYQCQYFTINSSISKCNHQCETQNTDPVMSRRWKVWQYLEVLVEYGEGVERIVLRNGGDVRRRRRSKEMVEV
jgi:hypothetical protein